MALPEVSNILWKERHLLDLLQFKLDEHQLLVGAGRAKWLTLATGEIERVLEELRHVELLRAIEVDAVATELGLPANASLAELAEAAPSPWDEIFGQHRAALLGAAEEVRALSDVNRALLERGEAALRQLVDAVDETVESGTYGRDAGTPRRQSILLDQVI